MADTNDIMNNLMGILNNGDAKNKLMDAISALGSSEQQETKEENSNVSSSPSFNFPSQISTDQMDAVMRIKNMLDRFNNISDDRIGLLNAIKPYMRAGRSKNIDMAINFIKILNFSNSFKS